MLPVCLGKATRACDMLSDSGKEYRAVLLLGRETDTQDVFGRTLSEKEVSVTEEEAREAVMGFEGDYSRSRPCIPPSRWMEKSFTSWQGREKRWSGRPGR